MADFKTHIGTSTAVGLVYGGAAYGLFQVPPQTCILAGALCSVSGMLPDVDSKSGRPLRETLAFISAMVPMMLVDRFRSLGVSPETTVLAGGLAYLLIRFGLSFFLKYYTVHRGMFHSLPAAVIFGELAFLLASGDDWRLRLYKAGGVTLGFVSHLVLDELYSIQWNFGWVRIKKSFGTALKVFSTKSVWANVSAYGKLALLSYVVFYEPGWVQRYQNYRAERWQQQATPRSSEEIVAGWVPKETPQKVQETASQFLDRLRR